MLSKLFSVGASLALAAGAEHPPKTGCIVANQLRCHGYLCPNWAMDISRYDTIRYSMDDPFEYELSENLPLGPTAERSFHMHSAYSSNTRQFVSAAADYFVGGVDSYWVATVNEYANATTPVVENVMLAHPDATPDHPGTLILRRLVTLSDERTVAVFSNGEVHEVDLKGKRYSILADVSKTSKFAAIMTDAHVVDGSVLKSIIMDADGASYLVKTDFSSSPAKTSDPIKLTNVQGANFETPINAFMLTTHDGDTPKLVVLLTGQFDQINYIDETTGVMTPIVSNLMESGSAIFACYESTKDCDTWRTSAFDKDVHMLYFQAHVVDAMGMQTVSMMKMGFTQSKVNGLWYPYVNVAMSPMNFGYAAYQFVTIKQN